ncbi:hypothetical protein C8Q74DRAFT_1373148 [Fomes fomentarius]|nr:hypothetical protein C8Q74DRAFT_1373148 [Fomes fomentarius]
MSSAASISSGDSGSLEGMLKKHDRVRKQTGRETVRGDEVLACLTYACRGALRAGILGLAVRSALDLLFVLLKMRRIPKYMRATSVGNALLGPKSMRFGSMLASFVAIYRLILGTVPVLRGQATRRYCDAQDAEADAVSGSAVIEEDKRPARPIDAERWMIPAIAGALAGAVAISCESRGQRTGIAQELFARGLQGWWRAVSQRYHIRVPHGDVLVYAVSLGQLMYSFVMHPSTITHPSLLPWLDGACQVPTQGLKMYRDLIQRGIIDPTDAETLMQRKDITPYNHAEIARRLVQAGADVVIPPSADMDVRRIPPCAVLHPAADGCLENSPAQFWRVFRWMLPGYIVAHVGSLIARSDVLRMNPLREIFGALLGAVRTSTFQGVYVMIYIGLFCGKGNLYRLIAKLRSSGRAHPLARLAKHLPASVSELLISEQSYWVLGFVSSVAFWIEQERRREMFNLYIFPRAMGSAWIVARGWGWVPHTGNYGDTLVAAIGMALIMSIYENKPRYLSGIVRRILQKVVGPPRCPENVVNTGKAQ